MKSMWPMMLSAPYDRVMELFEERQLFKHQIQVIINIVINFRISRMRQYCPFTRNCKVWKQLWMSLTRQEPGRQTTLITCPRPACALISTAALIVQFVILPLLCKTWLVCHSIANGFCQQGAGRRKHICPPTVTI